MKGAQSTLIPIPLEIVWILGGVIAAVFSLVSFASRRRLGQFQPALEECAAWVQPQLLAIGSAMDEAWQILYHLRNVDDPLAVRLNFKRYLFHSVHSRMSRTADIEHIRGAQPLKTLSAIKRWSCILSYVFSLLIFPILVAWFSGFSIFWRCILGVGTFLFVALIPAISVRSLHQNVPEGGSYSAFAAGYRWLSRLIFALLSLPTEVLTYVVRANAWRIMVAMAMGLEGYNFDTPGIEQQCPSSVPTNFVKYEEMPKGAERNALDKRGAWVDRHLKDISQTFSKLVLTAADMTALLRTIEEDQTLVHAAYYTDDECIARIAEWIASTE